MTDYKIVFIHGYTASHLSDWYPNISPELERLGVDFVVPDLPGGEHPHANEWLETLHDVISKLDKPIILVGHSLGTRTALLYLEKYKLKVEKVFLIAALANRKENAKRRDGKAYPDFFENNIDLDEIKPLVSKFIVMHSKDDDSIPYWQGKEIANDLNAELITYEDKGHFYNPEHASIVLEELRKELKF